MSTKHSKRVIIVLAAKADEGLHVAVNKYGTIIEGKNFLPDCAPNLETVDKYHKGSLRPRLTWIFFYFTFLHFTQKHRWLPC